MATKSDKVFSTRIPVLVKVELTTATPRVIWAHEMPVLQEIHGEDNVQPIPIEKFDEGWTEKISPALLQYNKTQDKVARPSESQGIGFVFIGNPAAEYNRLEMAYGRHKDIDMTVVEKVYGRYQAGNFERLLPRATLRDLPDQQLRALITDYGYPGDLNKDSTAEEKRVHADKVRELRVMPNAGLLKLADEMAIEI